MDNSLRQQIYNHMSLMETQELVEIWQKNDRVLWSGEAFDVIHQILLERGNNLLPQDEPILEYKNEETDNNINENEVLPDFIDGADEPEFYKPKEILWLKKWLVRASIGVVIVTIVSGLLQLPNLHITFYTFVNRSEWDIIAWVLAIITFLIACGIQSVILYFALNSLGYILTILMQMEFNSRGAKPTET